MSLSPRFLDELRARITLSEVIGRRIRVIRAGRESKACCPFHHEKSPSFTINDDKQFYHCFGCGAHGDVIKFVMQHDNLGFMDAVSLLAAEAGMQVPKLEPQNAKAAQEQKDLYALMDDAASYFTAQLHDRRNSDALDYLRGRGLSMETIKLFRLGFAPDDGQAIRHALKAKGYVDKDMISVGILKKSDRSAEPYAFFRDRVMFPVPDRRGRIVAFGGRVLPEHLRPQMNRDFKPPKYINTSQTPLFHKGGMMYGEPTARRASARGMNLVVVEGYLDVISSYQAGVEGALAPMGTALTQEQIASLWKMIPHPEKVPILCFDGDNAGRKAAQRVIERILPLLAPDCSVNFAFMPQGEDPDSLLKFGGLKAFQKVLDNSISLFDFLWNSHVGGKNLSTPESRAGVIKQLEDEVAHIQDKNVQMFYKSQLKQRIGDVFFARRTDFKARLEVPTHNLQRLRMPLRQGRSVFPRVLLAGVINHPHIFEEIEEIFVSMTFEDRELEGLRCAIVRYLSEYQGMEREVLIQKLEESGFNQVIGDILKESVYVHASFCAPSANVDEVQGAWIAYYKAGDEARMIKEIQGGWRNAWLNSSEDEEEKLRNLLHAKVIEDYL